jgi:hypothetical protein
VDGSKARVTLITLRDEGQVKAAVTQMAQLVKGTPGGGVMPAEEWRP